MAWFFEKNKKICREEMIELTDKAAEQCRQRICRNPRKVLLLPPDITRAHSGAGWITERFYEIFSAKADVYLMPTLGQHVPHTKQQNKWMFGKVPHKRILVHDWIKDCVRIGSIPSEYVRKITNGKADWEIPVSVNKILFEEDWDLIINIGHIVPHEVLGFANHNKNYFIGLGGKEMICASHMAAACFGIENNLGTLVTPLRHCFNKAEQEFLGRLPDAYIQVVLAYDDSDHLVHTGFYCGDDTDTYLLAAKQSAEENITIVPPLRKIISVMQGDEFHSTWVANKAVYRTRKAIADGGELIIIAPGLKRFGEQESVDKIIRKYGYSGTENIMNMWKKEKDLQDMSHAAAHLIHGSSENRFKITYCPGDLSKSDVEGVNFNYFKLDEALEKYPPDKMRNGHNRIGDEEVYFISTPSAGLWTTKEKMNI
jgi:nickel-dependent lactate racemase